MNSSPADLRVLIIDKTAGLAASHERHRALAALPGVSLHVLGPRRWIENGRPVEWNPPPDTNYAVWTGRVFGKDYYARAGYYSGLHRAMFASRPHIVQLLEEPWSVSAWQTAMAVRYACPRAKLLFYTWENMYRGWTYPSRAAALYRRIDALSRRRSSGAVCATQQALDVLRKKGYAKPARVIPYGIPDFFFQPAPRAAGDRPFTVGYLGRMLAMKGVDVLIDAVARVEGCRLLLAGGGADLDAFKRQAAAAGLDGRTEWLDPMPEEAVPAFLARLGVLVLPSRATPGWSEQLGRVLIEAMAAGVPVMGADSGAIPETIGGAGVLFEDGSAEQLAERLRWLMERPGERARLAEAGRKRARERFSWQRFAGELHRFHLEIMASNP